MSDYTSIRGVTLSLKTLLDDGLNSAPPAADQLGATITVSRPDIAQPNSAKRLNLYLYQIMENHCIANQEDPRIGTTRAYDHPPLCLNLRYLITPYATDIDEIEAHRLMGAAMRILYDNAILLPSLMTSANQPVLDTSLKQSIEHVRISLLPTTLDDLSKIWTGAQQSLRLSAAYEVTVVQIDSQQPRLSPLPVQERNVVVTLGQPRISAIDPNVVGVGDPLKIDGVNFFSATTRVLIGGATIVLSGHRTPTLTAQHIETTVPDDPSLWPGSVMVQVRTGADDANSLWTGSNPAWLMSESVPVLLIPKVTKITPPAEQGGMKHTLTIEGHRLYRAGDEAQCSVLIADQTIEARLFTIKQEKKIEIVVPDLAIGKYPVFVRFNAFTSRDIVEFEVT